MKKFILASVLALSVAPLFASNLASDNGVNYTSSTWASGSNLGTGFGAWTFATSGGGGKFVGTAGSPTALGADTFGVFASNTGANTSSASRAFTGGGLTAGQTFGLTIANTGTVASGGGEVGLNLLSGTTVVFTLKFVGGLTNWLINDGGTDFAASPNQPFTTSPLNFSLTYVGGVTGREYSYTFGNASGSNFVANVANTNFNNINGVKVYSNAQGVNQNVGFNNLVVAPEPSSISLLVISSLGACFLLRRRTL